MRRALSLFALTFFAGAAFADGPPADSIWSLDESVLAVAFSPDGKTLATGGGGQGGAAALWDVATLRRKAALDGAGMVHAIAYSPDGQRLATSSPRAGGPRNFTGPAVTVWDSATGKRLVRVETDYENVFGVAFRPDGKVLAIARADAVALYDGATGKRRALLTGHKGAVWGVKFSPDGKALASAGGEDGTVKLWDASAGKELRTLTGHRGAVGALAFTPDGKTLVSGGGAGHDRPGEVLLWDVATGKRTGSWKGFDGPVVDLAFSADGKVLAVAARFDGLKLRAFPSGRKLRDVEGPLNLTRLAFSPDGKWLAVAGGTGDPLISAGGVQLWDATTGRRRLSPAAEAARAKKEAAQARRLAEQAKARAERDRRRAEAKALLGEPEARARRAEYALRIGQAQEAVERWEFRTARAILDALQPKAGEEDLRGFEWYHLRRRLAREVILAETEARPGDYPAAVSPDGELAAVVSGKEIVLYETAKGRPRARLKRHDSFVHCLCFSPDGNLLASAASGGSSDGVIRLWDTDAAKEVATLRGHRGPVSQLRFSADGKTLGSAGSDRIVKLWDVASRKLRKTMEGYETGVDSVALSPDSKVVASSAVGDGTRLWEAATGKLRCALRPSYSSRAIAFSPDGRELVTGGDRMYVWDTATGKLLRALPGGAPQRYTPYGRSLLCGLSLVDAATGETRARYELGVGDRRHEATLASDLTSDGRVVAVVADKHHVRFIEFPFGPACRVLHHGPKDLYGAVFTEGGTRLVAVGFDGDVARWDGATGDWQLPPLVLWKDKGGEAVFPGKGPARVRLNGQDFTLAEFVALGGYARVKGEQGLVRFLAFSQGARAFVTAGDAAGALRDAATGQVRFRLPKFGIGVRAAAFAPDGKRLATWADDVVLWDSATGKELERFEPPGRVLLARFAPDGKSLATLLVTDREARTLRMWDVATGEVRATLRGHTDHVLTAVLSPDGTVLATAGSDSTVRLWDAVTGAPRGVLRGHVAWRIDHLAFRPDGRALAAASYGGQVTLWLGAGKE